MIRHGRLIGLLAALLMLVPFGPAAVRAASTVTVNTCDEAHLRAAIAAAGAGGTVTFSCSGTITLAATIAIGSSLSGLTIDGSGQAVTLSGGNKVQVFVVNSGVTLTLNRLSIVNGNAANAPFEGDGILNNGTLRVSNSAFSGNNGGDYGGGIYSSGTLSVTNSTFSNNTPPDGNGAGIFNTGAATVSGSTFSSNSVSQGAGAAIDNFGVLTLTTSTFTKNFSYESGGAIENVHGTFSVTSNTVMSVTDSTFSGNSCVHCGGGAIDNDSGALTVIHSTFSNNSAGIDDGGGINSFGTLSVSTSTFSGNSAGNNGGGIAGSGTLSVTNSTFSGNFAGVNCCASGGGIAVSSGTANVTGSTLTGNSASGGGGGISIAIRSTLHVTNSTFSGNSANNTNFGTGGGINNGGTLSVTNSTLSGNSAAVRGGGIDNVNGTTTLANTILASSPAGGNCAASAGTITDAGGNVDDDVTCGFSAANHSLSNTNPHLLPLANNGGPTQTMALPPGSPAIGAGLAATCLSTAPTSPVDNLDQRGQSRNAATRGVCDSGAFDTGGHSADTTPPSCQLTAVLAGPPKQLQVTMRDTGSGLRSVVATQATNATVSIPTFTAGTTSPVVVTATKVDQSLGAEVTLQATDVAGNVTRCDPVLTGLIRDEHRPTIVVARGIDGSEGVLHIANGDPGLSHLVVLVDGRKIQERDLEPNEQRTVDIAAALQPGDNNTVVVIARGKQRGEATLVIADS